MNAPPGSYRLPQMCTERVSRKRGGKNYAHKASAHLTFRQGVKGWRRPSAGRPRFGTGCVGSKLRSATGFSSPATHAGRRPSRHSLGVTRPVRLVCKRTHAATQVLLMDNPERHDAAQPLVGKGRANSADRTFFIFSYGGCPHPGSSVRRGFGGP